MPSSTRPRSATGSAPSSASARLPRQLQQVAELVRESPEVVECHRITGEDCYLIKAHVRSMTHLEEILDTLAPYGQTTTSIIQSSPVSGRGVEVPGFRSPR